VAAILLVANVKSLQAAEIWKSEGPLDCLNGD
jgi:hypothetical protein